MWPDWVIYWTLGNFLKPLATINLSTSPTFLGNFCKGVKIFYFYSEIIFRQRLNDIWRFFTGHTDRHPRNQISTHPSKPPSSQQTESLHLHLTHLQEDCSKDLKHTKTWKHADTYFHTHKTIPRALFPSTMILDIQIHLTHSLSFSFYVYVYPFLLDHSSLYLCLLFRWKAIFSEISGRSNLWSAFETFFVRKNSSRWLATRSKRVKFSSGN